MRNPITALLAAAALALVAVGCTDSPSKPKDPKPAERGSISINADRENVIGEIVRVTAILRDSAGNVVPNYPVTARTSSGILSTDGVLTAGNQTLPLRTNANGEVLFYVYSGTETVAEVKVTSSGDVPADGSTLVEWNVSLCGDFLVTSVSPTAGSPTGGYDVAVIGSGFCQQDAPKVYFDTVEAVVKSVTSERILVTAPPAPADAEIPLTVDVTVKLRTGQATEASKILADAFTYRVDAPVITSISPVSGPPEGKTPVTINGQNFAPIGSVQVFFGERAAVVTESTPGQIRVLSPEAPTGSDLPLNVDVKVVNYPGTSYSATAIFTSGFTYTFAVAEPEITAVDPQFGASTGGDTVHVFGRNFAAEAQILFEGRPAEVLFRSSGPTSDWTVRTPVPPAGSTFPFLADVTVINNPGSAFLAQDTLPDAFQYLAPPISTILNIGPANCQVGGGCAVTITGTNFCASPQVLVGGAAATVTSSSSTSISIIVPPAPAGTDPSVATSVEVCVVCNPGAADEQRTCRNPGIVYGCETSPSIFAVSPSSGEIQGQTEMTIFGTGFNASGGVQVFFDSTGDHVEVDVVSVSATQIKVNTPEVNRFVDYIDVVNNQSPITVSVRLVGCGANASLDNAYRYKLPWAISTLSPSQIRVGSSGLVAINGQGFAMPLVVTAGGSPVQLVSVADTQIIVNVSELVGECGSGGGLEFGVCSTSYAGICATTGPSSGLRILGAEISGVSPSSVAYPGGFPATVTLSGEGLIYPGEVTFAGYTLTLPQSAFGSGTVTVSLPPPPISALQQIPCFLGACTGLQYVTTGFPIVFTPAGFTSCRATTTIFVTPTDTACRVTAPTASFTAAPGAALTHTVTFTDSSTPGQAGSTITSRAWTFAPDGVPANATGTTVTVNFVTAGAKSATLTVTDSCGSTATTTQTVTAP